jgi:hypothetical protein
MGACQSTSAAHIGQNEVSKKSVQHVQKKIGQGNCKCLVIGISTKPFHMQHFDIRHRCLYITLSKKTNSQPIFVVFYNPMCVVVGVGIVYCEALIQSVNIFDIFICGAYLMLLENGVKTRTFW